MRVLNKNNANTMIIFTFDDFYSKWNELGELLNKYNIKATFFITSKDLIDKNNINKNNIDLIYNLIELKHEISNHTHTHLVLENNNQDKFIEEYKLCDKYLKDLFDINNLSFSFVGGELLGHNCFTNTNNLFTKPIRSSRKLWKQIYMKNNNFEFNFIPIIEYKSVDTLNNYLEENKINIYFGHSIDGEGYRPIKKNILELNLKFITNKKNIYIDTFTNIFSYIYLFEHQKINKLQDNDLLTIYELKNDKVNKIYKYCDYLTFEISNEYNKAFIQEKEYSIQIINNIQTINIPIILLNEIISLIKIYP